ncbi:hypothetical protein [Streptomyces phaeochromogenes]
MQKLHRTSLLLPGQHLIHRVDHGCQNVGAAASEDRAVIDQLSALPADVNTVLQRWLHHTV